MILVRMYECIPSFSYCYALYYDYICKQHPTYMLINTNLYLI